MTGECADNQGYADAAARGGSAAERSSGDRSDSVGREM